MTDEEWASIHMIAREEAQTVVVSHLKLCPFFSLGIEPRLRAVEMRLTTLIGFMAGSGLLGGISGAFLSKLMK